MPQLIELAELSLSGKGRGAFQMWDCGGGVELTAEGAIGVTPARCFASEGVISTRATPFLVMPSF